MSMIPSGTEQATSGLVAQCLNQLLIVISYIQEYDKSTRRSNSAILRLNYT